MIRTGPAEFSKWVVSPRKYGGRLPSDLVVKDGAVWRKKQIIPMPTEEDFFDLLGLRFIPPEDRGHWNV